eukprot:m51a1_g9481 hypothetical protein (341) ;mRNA; f:608201-609909
MSEELRVVEAENAAVWGVALSPDSSALFCAGSFGSAALWSFPPKRARAKPAAMWRAHSGGGGSGAVWAVSSCPEAGLVATGAADGVALWRWPAEPAQPLEVARLSHRPSATAQLPAPLAHRETNAIAFSGSAMVCGCGDGVAYVYDVAGGCAAVGELAGHKGPVLACAARPGTQHEVLTGSEDGSVLLWDLRTRTCEATFAPPRARGASGAGGWVSAVAVDPTGEWLACATGGADGCLSLWHIPSRLNVLVTDRLAARALVWSQESQVVCGLADGSVQRVRMTGSLEARASTCLPCIHALALCPDGKTVIAAGASATVEVVGAAAEESRTLSFTHPEIAD